MKAIYKDYLFTCDGDEGDKALLRDSGDWTLKTRLGDDALIIDPTDDEVRHAHNLWVTNPPATEAELSAARRLIEHDYEDPELYRRDRQTIGFRSGNEKDAAMALILRHLDDVKRMIAYRIEVLTAAGLREQDPSQLQECLNLLKGTKA